MTVFHFPRLLNDFWICSHNVKSPDNQEIYDSITVGIFLSTVFFWHYFYCFCDVFVIDLIKCSAVCFGCILHIDRHLAYDRYIQFCCNFLNMTFTKDLEFLAAVWTFHITVVFYDSKYRDLHHFSHIISFLYNHLHQILRGAYDHDSVNRKGLKYSKRHIACSRRHIYKEIVDLVPDNICPELFYHVCKNRSSPDNRSIFRWKKKVDGHNLDSVCCLHRIDAVVM